MAHVWPLFDLEVRTPRIALQYVDDALGEQLVALIERGIHDPATMPFATPWTDAEPPELGRNAFRFWWGCRTETSPDAWNLNFAVIADGEVVGSTGLRAAHFPVTRSFETGSWVGRAHQGHGWGTELRIACLHLGFVGLDADVATTGAFGDNAASLAVTRKLGYEPNGTERIVRRDEVGVIQRFLMTREHFDAHVRRDDVEIVGDEPVRELLGVER